MHLWAWRPNLCTFVAKRSSVSGWAAVAGEAGGSLHTATLILAQRAIAATMTWASCLNPRGDLCSLLQVQSDAIQLQRADATSKALLPWSCASWTHRGHTEKKKAYTVMNFLCCLFYSTYVSVQTTKIDITWNNIIPVMIKHLTVAWRTS